MRRFIRAANLAATAVLVVISGCSGGSGSSPSATSLPIDTGATTPPDLTPSRPDPAQEAVFIPKAQAFKFLNQATFGATEAEANRLIALGDTNTRYARWITEQLALPASVQLPYVQAARPVPPPAGFDYSRLNMDREDIWFQNSLWGRDQLRQRVAWALSQILVVSQVSLASRYPLGLAHYYDTLARHAFGDFRQLLEEVTLHPMMGVYLSMLGNRRPNVALNIRPDENYAREIMQLFSIGLVQLSSGGTPRLDAAGVPIPTYNQATIQGFAHVFTGWNWACLPGSSPAGCNFTTTRGTVPNGYVPMQLFPAEHDTGQKRLLVYAGAPNSVIPAGQPPMEDLEDALDNIFRHPNVGPFISKQLIQRLVTSNPSFNYVARVSTVFNNDGTGRRGNLGAVVRAILLDPEARTSNIAAINASKLKEPALRLTQFWRAYNGRSRSGRYYNIVGDMRNTYASIPLGQGPLQAPSVFNYYSPFYAPPGEITNLGVVAPELQIATEYQNTLTTNFFYQQVYSRNTRSTVSDAIVRVNIEPEIALSNTPIPLVELVAQKLVAGQITATTRARAEQLVTQIPATDRVGRAAAAVWLISTSPDFATQR